MKYVVGKWYQGKGEKVFGKLTSKIKKPGIFPCKQYIELDGTYISCGNYYEGENWTLYAREVELWEIQEFLPKNHPDLQEIKTDYACILPILDKLNIK